MSNTDRSITSRQGAIFIQPDGPNTQMRYLNARTLGDLEINHGSRELIQHFDEHGNYFTAGSTKGAPEIITTSMEIMLKRKPDWMERVTPTNGGFNCQFPLYVMQRVCGRANDDTNFVRLIRITRADISTENYSQIVALMEDQSSMLNLDIEAEPPAGVFHEVLGRRQTFGENIAINDVWFNQDGQCDSDCGTIYSPGDIGMLVCDAGAGVSANIYFTSDGGTTWTVIGTDPFGNDEHARAVTAFEIGNGQMRFVLAVDATAVAGGQGLIAYGDATIGSAPTAWTTVNIGGATAGHGATHSKCLFALDKEHIWLATSAGYIYFSSDAGVTWTAQESGVIHTGAYWGINFADDTYGVAVGAADVVAVTTNGGDSWVAATATGATGIINTCWQLDNNRMWAGTANGRLYYSNDGGTTWTRRTGFTNDGVGQIRSMHWLDEFTGIIAHNNASPVGTFRYTVNGGYTWINITTVTNAGLNSVFLVKNNLAFTVGEAASSLGYIGKASLLFSEFD